MGQESIESKLKSIKRWHFVPNKNRIIPFLESAVSGDEYIVDLIDGFFPGETGPDMSRSDSGLILVTDRTVVLLKSDSPGKYVSLKKERIKSINCIKNFSSLTIKIEYGKDTHLFVTQLSEFAIKNIFSAAGRPVEKINTQQEINRADTGSVESTPGVSELRQSSASGLLYPEVRKISAKLGDFRREVPGKELMEMFRDDIFTISALCGMSSKELADNEILFICMVISAAEDNPGSESFLEEVMLHDRFPLHLRDMINMRMNDIMTGINKMNGVDDKRLKSLEFLAGYDKKNETMHADRMASLFYEYSQCLLKADGTVDGGEEIRLKTVSDLIQKSQHVRTGPPESSSESEETIDQVMEKINRLVGMDNIKDEIKSFINFVSIRSEREKRNLPVTPLSLHAVFYGPPGTGKTTIARLLGRVYRALGLLKSGHLVETDRAGLVAGYVGQTAIKTDEIVGKAKDGVLFIDEAYTLVPENSANDFGRESVDTILKRMEDMREGFAVIAAGYTDEMERFINSNPGLKSRFSRYFYFNHYTPVELVKIFNIFAENVEFKLNADAAEKLKDLITFFYNERSRSFGNARFVRNVFDRIVQNQADRLASNTVLTDELLCEVRAEDIPEKEDFSSEQFS